MKETRTFGNFTVTKEVKSIVGADWKEQLKKTGSAGHKVTVYEVTAQHDNFVEVVLKNDPRFKEALEAVGWSEHGGSRPGAGRPPLPEDEVRKARSVKFSDTEWEQVKEKAKASGMNISEYIRSNTLKEEEEMLKTYKMRDGLTGAFCPISWEVNGEKVVHSFCRIEEADPKIVASTPWFPGEEEKEGDIYLVCLDQTEE